MSSFAVAQRMAAASLQNNGFAIIPLAEPLTCHIDLLLDQARTFFDSTVAKADARSLEHLNDVARFYTGDEEKLFDELRQVSPTQQVIHLTRGGYLAERYFQHAETLRGTVFPDATSEGSGNHKSLIDLAHSLLLELVRPHCEDGEPESFLHPSFLNPCLAGCIENSQLSIYSTGPSASADKEMNFCGPAGVDRGFLTLCYAESARLEVQHPSGEWQQTAGSRGCLVLMAGGLLSRITEEAFFPSVHRLRFQAPSLPLVFSLRPSQDTWIEWPLGPCSYQSLLKSARETRQRRQAGELMDAVDGLTGEELAVAEPVSARTELVAEVLTQQQRWVALMMGLHPRLGAQSLLARFGGVPMEIWKMVCVDAMGFNVFVSVLNHSWAIKKTMTAYSALKEVPVIQVLAREFKRSKLKMSKFKLTVAENTLKRYQTLAKQGLGGGSAILAIPLEIVPADAMAIEVIVLDGHLVGTSVRFKIHSHTRFAKLQQAVCSYFQLPFVKFHKCCRGRPQIWGYQTAECVGLRDGGMLEASILA